MDSTWFIIYVVLAGAAILQSLLLALHAWEHRRFGRSCLRGVGWPTPVGRALVLAPCKGNDADLEDNLRALMRQDYADYEVTFVVESSDDPACPVIRRVMAEHPQATTRLLVAGRASDSGQKVHNLRMATASLAPSIRYLALLDCDGRPRPQWLGRALAPLCGSKIGATTGYRWFIPKRPSTANYLLSLINCNIMSLMGRYSSGLLWGGSWALRRETFEQIGLHQAWQGTLSDDLVAARVLGQARLPSRFEPSCVVASPLDLSLGQMFAFIRRQYLMGRHYAVGWWAFALVNTSIRNLAWAGSLAALPLALLTGNPPIEIPAAVLGLLFALDVFHGSVIQDLARAYFPEQYPLLRGVRRFALWAEPLAGLIHWLAILSTIIGPRITWHGIRYRILPAGQVVLELRVEEGIRDWGLGIREERNAAAGDSHQSIPNPQSPIPNPQSPIPNP